MKPLVLASLVTFLLDQATKWLVVQRMNLQSVGEIDVLPPFLNLRMAWNRGVNFGLFGSDAEVARYALIGLALAISVAVVWFTRKSARRTQVLAGLLIGGALGNAFDRAIYGAVADFLNMSCCGIDNPFAFNIADVAIFVGAISLAIWSDRKA